VHVLYSYKTRYEFPLEYPERCYREDDVSAPRRRNFFRHRVIAARSWRTRVGARTLGDLGSLMRFWTVLKGIPLLGVMRRAWREPVPARARARARPSRLNPFEIMLVGYRRCCRHDPEATLNLMNRLGCSPHARWILAANSVRRRKGTAFSPWFDGDSKGPMSTNWEYRANGRDQNSRRFSSNSLRGFSAWCHSSPTWLFSRTLEKSGPDSIKGKAKTRWFLSSHTFLHIEASRSRCLRYSHNSRDTRVRMRCRWRFTSATLMQRPCKTARIRATERRRPWGTSSHDRHFFLLLLFSPLRELDREPQRACDIQNSITILRFNSALNLHKLHSSSQHLFGNPSRSDRLTRNDRFAITTRSDVTRKKDLLGQGEGGEGLNESRRGNSCREWTRALWGEATRDLSRVDARMESPVKEVSREGASGGKEGEARWG